MIRMAAELARDQVVITAINWMPTLELFNVQNGTIDLRTGELLRHNPDNLLTMQAPVMFDERERYGVTVVEVPGRVAAGPEMRRYLQVRAGAAITGRHTETFDVDYGTGGNGKGKFHGAIQHILGPYAVVPHKSLLVATQHQEHQTVLAALFRKRFAIASETEQRCTLNEEQVKNDRWRCHIRSPDAGRPVGVPA